jgi:DNA invertase Pin-like site-specific DNA recombinase
MATRSRWCRPARTLTRRIVDHGRHAQIKERGIALLSLEERIDTNSDAGELVFHVFGAIAHFERRLIAERTKDGIAAARARGKHPGRRPLDADKIAAALVGGGTH